MKKFALLFQILFFCVTSLFSQTSIEPSRVAFINPYQFYDDKKGVEILKKASAQLSEDVFGDPTVLYESKEIAEQKKIALENKELTPIQKAELEKSLFDLNNRIKEMVKQRDEVLERRKKIILKPLLDKIETQLNLIAEQNNLIIFDLNELDEMGQLLYLDEKTDVTKIIIPILNDFLNTNILLPTKFDIPQPKIALLNTEIFSDEINGINELVVYQKEVAKAMKAELGENPTTEQVDSWNKSEHKIKGSEVFGKIRNAIQTFAKTKEITLIIDSSKNVPAKLQKFPSDDVTNQFISYYNQ